MSRNKNLVVLGTFLLIQLIFYFVYINRSSANIIFQDQFDFIPILEKLSDGSLSFSDLWQAHMEHRVLGYNLIVLFNAIFFNTNTIIEMYLGGLVLMVIAIILYKPYIRSFKETNNKYVPSAVFLLISCLLFSLIQWENIVLSLGMSIMMRMMFFIITFIVFDNLIIRGLRKKDIFLLVLSLAINILVFGAGYSPAVVLTCVVVLIINFFVTPLDRKNTKVILGLISIASLIFYIVYFHNIYINNLINEDKSILEKAMHIFSNIFEAMKFFFITLSSSVIGVSIFDKYLSVNFMIVLGCILFILIFYFLYLYFREKLYKRSWLPFMLIIYSFMIMGLILLGRFNYALTYGSSSRYTTDTQYIVIGFLWIVSLVLSHKKSFCKLQLDRTLSIISIFFVVVSFAITNVMEWQISSSRGQYFENLQTIALNIDKATDKELSQFQYPPDIVKYGLVSLRNNSLNVYHENMGNTQGSYLYEKNIAGISGWYENDESEARWTKKEVEFKVQSEGRRGSISIQAYVPKYLHNTQIIVEVNGSMIMQKIFEEGENKIDIPISKDEMYIKLIQSKTFVPKDHGVNDDIRDLGILVKKIEIIPVL
ncbi:hypothetical protein ABN764_06540 [Paenibacillaceae sp. P-4]|uniref:hypothetical protein n=1 Tax=Paenibacillaceae bacterium P-4 TaxID=3160969 RepID=UPI0032E81E0B